VAEKYIKTRGQKQETEVKTKGLFMFTVICGSLSQHNQRLQIKPQSWS